MRRSTLLAALLLAAMALGGDAQVVSCPYTSPSWNMVAASPAVIPQGANCSTTSISTVFVYWTPELSGSSLSSGTGNNPSPQFTNIVNPVPRDAAGVALSAPGVSCQWGSLNFGAFPAPTTVPPPTSVPRTCGNITVANAATLPAAAIAANTTADSAAECCRRCTNTIACRQFAYVSTNVTAVNASCILYSATGTFNATGTAIAVVGNSAGWGSGFVTCTGANIGDIRSVLLPLSTSGLTAYNQLCANGSTPGVLPPDTTTSVAVAAPADAPVANVSSLTVTNVCAGAAAVTGTFFYSGSNIAGQTAFAVTLNGATCTPGAANIAGNNAGTTVSYTCNVAGGVAAGALNVTVTAAYSGSQTTGGCAGVKTAGASASGTATAAPTASFGAAPVVPNVCTGNTQIIADFIYTSSAANTTFVATSSPASTCVATPLTVVGGSTNQTIRVTCTKAAPGFAAGTAVITLSATFTGSAPCTGASTISTSASVPVVNAESGVGVTVVATPEKCAPTKSVAAAFRFNATNVGTISFAAASPGLSCTTDQTTASGSTGTVSYVVSATCTSATDIPAGTVPITLTATYLGQGPCAGGSVSSIPPAVVTISPTPSVTVAPKTSTPAPDCFGAQVVTEDFSVVLANGATNAALTALLAGAFPCTVTPAVVPANATVSVSCTAPTDLGFPSGKHNLTIQATAAGPVGACAGTYSGSAYTTITVKPEPVLAITPVTVDEPICAGDPAVEVVWRYDVSGTVSNTPLVTATNVIADNGATCVLTAPAGNNTRGTVRALCTNLPTTSADLAITLTMTVTEPGCGTVTTESTNTYSVACCLYNTTAYAKVADNNPNPPFCHKHQRPNNVQTRNCPYYYGWFNQGPTTSDVADIDSVSKMVAMTDPTSPGCATVTEVGDITAVCEGVLDVPGTGAIPGTPSLGTNVLKVTLSGYKYSNVRTFVYAGCPKIRTGDIPLSSTTCPNNAGTWKSATTWARYAPRFITDVPAGRAPSLEFRIPISSTGSCTCANLYWTVVQTGTFKGVPCPVTP